jgi:uncharacterized membrane protein YhaH (DUF805 family)
MTYVPMGGYYEPGEPEGREYVTRPVGQEPVPAWVMVFLPLPQLIQFPGGSLTLVPTLIIAAITGAIGVALAFADQSILIRNSHVRRTSPWLALLPIIYLGIRSSRRFDETGKGMKPFWWHVAIVVVVSFLVYWGPDGVAGFLL